MADEHLRSSIVLPVHNEERVVAGSVERLHAYLSNGFPFSWRIVIADNGSTDSTLSIARQLAERLPSVDVVEVAGPGAGRALKAAWGRSTADVVAYTDVDLSTGLDGTAAARRSARLGTFGPRHRLAPECRLSRRSRAEA